MRRRIYTPEEIKIIMKSYPLGASQAAHDALLDKGFFRTKEAIVEKAKKLGIKYERPTRKIKLDRYQQQTILDYYEKYGVVEIQNHFYNMGFAVPKEEIITGFFYQNYEQRKAS